MSEQPSLTPQAIEKASFNTEGALNMFCALGRHFAGSEHLDNDLPAVQEALTMMVKCRAAAAPIIREAENFFIRAGSNEPPPVLTNSSSELTAATWHSLALDLVDTFLIRAWRAVNQTSLIQAIAKEPSNAVDLFPVEAALEKWPVVRAELLRQPKVQIGPFAARLKRESTLAAKALENQHSAEPAKSGQFQVKERTVLVNGSPIPLGMTPERTDDALAFLEVLAAEPGNWFSSSDIGKVKSREGVRFDLVFKSLPKPVKALIESNRRKGYRLLRK